MPIAKLVPIGREEAGDISRIGLLEHTFRIPNDFDRMHSAEIITKLSGAA